MFVFAVFEFQKFTVDRWTRLFDAVTPPRGFTLIVPLVYPGIQLKHQSISMAESAVEICSKWS